MSTILNEIKSLEIFTNNASDSLKIRNILLKRINDDQPNTNELLITATLDDILQYLLSAKDDDQITFQEIDFINLFAKVLAGMFSIVKYNDRTFICIFILVLKMSYPYGKDETEWNLLINNEEILNTLIKDAICSIV